LAPVSFSPRAAEVMAKRKTKVQSWYLDLSILQRYWGDDRLYHHTTPITMMYALREGLRLLHEEGLRPRWDRHLRNHKALAAGLGQGRQLQSVKGAPGRGVAVANDCYANREK